jgi:hypothetical protein
LLGRVLIKDIPFEPLSFISILLRHEAKCMKIKNKRNEAKKTEMGMLEREILDLKGETREAAIKAYRKLLFDSADDMTYLARV